MKDIFSRKFIKLIDESDCFNPNDPGHQSILKSYFYLKDGEPCFKIGKYFGDELIKVDLNISSSNIKFDDCFKYIEFQSDDLFDSDYEIQCAFVLLNTTICLENNKNLIAFCVPYFIKSKNMFGIFCATTDFISEEENNKKNVSDIVESINIESAYNDNAIFRSVLCYVFKCLVYINSGDPDLRIKKAITIKTKNKKKIRKHQKNEDDLNIIYVGFNYKKSFFYNKNETSVCGHFRWQPYGEQRSKVKLIWINEHKRTFNKEMEN